MKLGRQLRTPVDRLCTVVSNTLDYIEKRNASRPFSQDGRNSVGASDNSNHRLRGSKILVALRMQVVVRSIPPFRPLNQTLRAADKEGAAYYPPISSFVVPILVEIGQLAQLVQVIGD